MAASRLVLGTVQLGMDYGVANRQGKPSEDNAQAIVAAAWEGGVRLFDTAQGYGDSEAVLGSVFSRLGIVAEARVVTKLHPAMDLLNAGLVRRSVEASLERLGCSKAYGLMLHREEQLELWGQGLGNTLRGLVRDGLAERLGVSVYSPDAALAVLRTEGFDMIQVPSNVLDQRFERAGVFAIAEKLGKEVHVRSVFLQGLFFLEPGDLRGNLAHAGPVLRRLRGLAGEAGLSLQQFALAYARVAWPQASILFGAEAPGQVRENLAAFDCEFPADMVRKVRDAFAEVDDVILNPSKWRLDT